MAIVEDAAFVVRSTCWRRGPDGSLCLYEVEQVGPFRRVFESEEHSVSDAVAEAAAQDIMRQIVGQIYPQLLSAVRSAQGQPWKTD